MNGLSIARSDEFTPPLVMTADHPYYGRRCYICAAGVLGGERYHVVTDVQIPDYGHVVDLVHQACEDWARS